MSKNFAVMRIAKIKSKKQLRGALSHNFRLMPDTEGVDPEKTKYNKHVPNLDTYDKCMSQYDERLDKHKPRKGAVYAHELVITVSPEKAAEMSRKELIAYFNDATKWADKMNGGGKNRVSVALHFDEQTPHAHLIYIPMKNGKLASRDMLGSIQEVIDPAAKRKSYRTLKTSADRLSEFQTDFADKVGLKHGMVRGVKRHGTGESVNHQTIKEYREKLPKDIERMTNDIKSLKEDKEWTLSELSGAKQELLKIQSEVNGLGGVKNVLESDIERLKELQQTVKTMTLNALREQIASIEQEQEYSRPRMGR